MNRKPSEFSALVASLRELVNLAEHGDADQDLDNWHPALNRARALIEAHDEAIRTELRQRARGTA